MLPDRLVEAILISSIVMTWVAILAGIVLARIRRASKWWWRGWAASGLFIAVMGLNSGLNPDLGTPKESELTFTSGTLISWERRQNIMLFRLSDSDVTFSYSSKNGGNGDAWKRTVEGNTIQFAHTPVENGRASVFGLTVDGSAVRTYKQVAASRRNDGRFGWGLFVMGLLGLCLFWRESNKPIYRSRDRA